MSAYVGSTGRTGGAARAGCEPGTERGARTDHRTNWCLAGSGFPFLIEGADRNHTMRRDGATDDVWAEHTANEGTGAGGRD